MLISYFYLTVSQEETLIRNELKVIRVDPRARIISQAVLATKLSVSPLSPSFLCKKKEKMLKKKHISHIASKQVVLLWHKFMKNLSICRVSVPILKILFPILRRNTFPYRGLGSWPLAVAAFQRCSVRFPRRRWAAELWTRSWIWLGEGSVPKMILK